MPTNTQTEADAGAQIARIRNKPRMGVWFGFMWRFVLSAIVGAILNPVLETLIGTALALFFVAVDKIGTSLSNVPTASGPTEDLTFIVVFMPAYFFVPTASVPGALAAILYRVFRRKRWLLWSSLVVVSIGQVLAIQHLYYWSSSIVGHSQLFAVMVVLVWAGTLLTTVVLERMSQR